MNGWPLKIRASARWFCGLELVVELVADPRADLLGRGLDVEAGRDPLHQPQDHPEVLHVGPDRGGDARVLDLDRDDAAVVQPRPVDLADRGGRDRLLVELGEDLAQRRLELGLDHLAHVGEAHLRRRVAQLAELALELLAVLLGHEPDVEEAHHLPELHRRALHRPERGRRSARRPRGGGARARRSCRPRSARGWSRACRAGAPPGPAARLETRAVREIREVGMRSLAIRASPSAAGSPRWAGTVAVGAGVAARGVGRRRWPTGVGGLGGGGRRGLLGGRGLGRRGGRGRGGRRRRVGLAGLPAQQAGRALGVADLVAEERRARTP